MIELGREKRLEFRRVAHDGAAAAAVGQAGLPAEFADILERGGPAGAAGAIS